MTFLEQIVHELKQEFGKGIADLTLIVPTRRAVVFLRQALAKAYQQTIWAPRMVSIQDFVRQTDGRQFPDIMPLVFELYQCYGQVMRKTDPQWHETFEQFYNWGEMLVKDFDEVDKYLVDAKQLFTNIKDLKEIEAFFDLPPENLEHVKRFWETLRGKGEDLHEVQKRFLKIWQNLHPVYDLYRQTLQRKGMAYDGMAYRKLIQRLKGAEDVFPAQQTLIFVGFNALSSAEEQLMGHLLKARQAIVYWDVDLAYFTPPKDKWNLGKEIYTDKSGHLTGEEPGKFIREYHSKWRDLESRLVISDMGQRNKEIYVTGVPLQVGQAQYLGNLLQEAPLAPDQYQEHAIILADEQLLFPTLYALPRKIEHLNITMGFPLRQTNIHDLLLRVMNLLRTQRMSPEKTPIFPYREVVDLLNNPYLKAQAPELSQQLQEKITKQNLLFVPGTMLTEVGLPLLLKHIFSPPESKGAPDLEALLDYSEEIFTYLLADTAGENDTLEAEYTFQFFLQFQQLRNVLSTYQPNISVRGFANLFRDVIQRARIPFEGEPLLGVQLMGFLETRVLDFDKLYILASNEGKLPDTSKGTSFIPYSLRQGFGLPTYEEKDAIYAYHFYRLLQRASEVHLIFNNQNEQAGQTNEPSRFIRQIEHFFQGHPHLHVHQRTIATPAPYVEPSAISIPVDGDIQRLLTQRFTTQEAGAERKRYFSATALTTYLTCPLQFYFRYLAGIREPEEVEESMAANTFGSVFHQAMEYLYKPFKGKQRSLTDQDFAEIKPRIEAAVKQAFADYELGWDEQVRGRNYLLRSVILTQCKRVIELDEEGPEFQIVDLENHKGYLRTISTSWGDVRVNGAFDRIDWLPEVETYRILDYKTGRVELSPRATLDDAFSDSKHKQMLQGYLYTWLFDRQHPQSRVQVGFVPVKQVGQGIQYLAGGKPIESAELQGFEQRLGQLAEEIYTNQFCQTEDEQKCSYCAYRMICNRG